MIDAETFKDRLIEAVMADPRLETRDALGVFLIVEHATAVLADLQKREREKLREIREQYEARRKPILDALARAVGVPPPR